LRAFLEDDEHKILDNISKTLSVKEPEYDDRKIYGNFKAGEFNIAADFLDTENGNTTENARKTKDSEVYPYFYLLYIPRNSEKGILILQTFGVHAIKGLLQKCINDFIKEYADNIDNEELKSCLIQINPLISRDLLEKLESSEEVHEITLIKNKISRNTARLLTNKRTNQRMTIGDPDNIKEIRKLVIRNKKKGFMDKQNIVDSLRNVEDAYAEIIEENYDEINITVTIDGSEKTIHFGSKNKYTEALPLTEESIVFGDNGFPAYSYLKTTSIGYLNYLNRDTSENSDD
jgi:hypothetical protein